MRSAMPVWFPETSPAVSPGFKLVNWGGGGYGQVCPIGQGNDRPVADDSLLKSYSGGDPRHVPSYLSPDLEIHSDYPAIRYHGREYPLSPLQNTFLRLMNDFEGEGRYDYLRAVCWDHPVIEQHGYASFDAFIAGLNKILARLGLTKIFRIQGGDIRFVDQASGFGLQTSGVASSEVLTPEVRNRESARRTP